MQSKHLFVLINIWTEGEVGGPLNLFKPSSKIFLLIVPRWCYFCGSFMLFLSCLFFFVFVVVCLLMPCGHQLGKGWPLGSRLWCLIVTLTLSHWYPGSGVVLDCIDSWSLPSFWLCEHRIYSHIIVCSLALKHYSSCLFLNRSFKRIIDTCNG